MNHELAQFILALTDADLEWLVRFDDRCDDYLLPPPWGYPA